MLEDFKVRGMDDVNVSHKQCNIKITTCALAIGIVDHVDLNESLPFLHEGLTLCTTAMFHDNIGLLSYLQLEFETQIF